MKLSNIILTTLLLTTPVMAATEPTKPTEKPSCGKTVEECQKVVDSQAATIKTQTTAINGLQLQRDNAQKNFLNQELQTYIQQQQQGNK